MSALDDYYAQLESEAKNAKSSIFDKIANGYIDMETYLQDAKRNLYGNPSEDQLRRELQRQKNADILASQERVDASNPSVNYSPGLFEKLKSDWRDAANFDWRNRENVAPQYQLDVYGNISAPTPPQPALEFSSTRPVDVRAHAIPEGWQQSGQAPEQLSQETLAALIPEERAAQAQGYVPAKVQIVSQLSQPVKSQTQFQFPEDVYNQKKQEGLNLKAQSISKINEIARLLPHNEREDFRKSLTSEMEAALAAKNLRTEEFSKVSPHVEALGKELLNDNTKRSSIADAISSQLKAIDAPIPKGVSPENHAANIIRELSGPWLKTVNGIMGTSDAIAEREGDRLMGGTTGQWVNFSNFLRQGKSMFENTPDQLAVYKKTLVDVMHTLQSQSNLSFNKIALQSSPETAQNFLGPDLQKPYAGKVDQRYGTPISPISRITRENPQVQSATAPEARKTRSRIIGPGGKFIDTP